MTRTRVKTYQYKVGKNKYLVIKIYQTSTAKAKRGNVLASNAVNVQIFKKQKRH
ncbi:hypothetical protein [Alicyclobacillus dauci]|uniref:AP2-like DNA-binding integrase domain-containing protein n=1 Tax=Alicyclobacillus dauci TaxID=1475485 RepID=A0ABY6Z6J8_9BACL|nr:hypothetical protein [Alicyclobacillus dauci]WAH37811.1 hypothetical protein NZD86_04715 [Alicyclobacillus dauci]